MQDKRHDVKVDNNAVLIPHLKGGCAGSRGAVIEQTVRMKAEEVCDVRSAGG